MEHLLEGIEKYQARTYQSQSNLMHQLESGQSPHTFLITCSDSGISVNEFITTKLGEVFGGLYHIGNKEISPKYDLRKLNLEGDK